MDSFEKRGVYLHRLRKLAARKAAQAFAKRSRRAARYRQPLVSTFTAPGTQRRVAYFQSPPKLDLSENFSQTVEFLMRFRKWGDQSKYAAFYVDLRPIQGITPAAALLLAAEFDRWRSIHTRRLRARDANEWDPNVRALLKQMGFFELLNVESDEETSPASVPHSNTSFLPFTSGQSTDGAPIRKLREHIESSAGAFATKSKLLFFQALSEAITNVRHHAYDSKLSNRLSRWWMSASIDFDEATVTVMILDHGQGIPRTLPRKTMGEGNKEDFLKRLREALGVQSLVGFNNDAKMIDAAITLGRTRTGLQHRGHGLTRDIQWLVKRIDGKATLRIYSNRGKYLFEKSVNGKTNTVLSNLEPSLDGTFVEWRFELPQLGLNLK